MPARSRAQRIAASIAEHHPEELYERNKGMAEMSQKSLHEFAATSEKGLPTKVKAKKKTEVRHKQPPGRGRTR